MSSDSAHPADLKDRVKASYDAIATEYNDWTKDHWPLKIKHLDQMLAKLDGTTATTSATATDPKPARRFLELGCGAGLPVLDHLLSRDPATTVVANDLSTTQLDLARTNLAKHGAERIEYAPGDMLALSFPDASFDGVVALYSICHLPPREQVAMFAKIAAWVRPGGTVLVNVVNQASGAITADKWLAEDKESWMYWSGLGPEQTVQVVRESGLEVLDTVVDGGKDDFFFWIIARKQSD
ncbi:methyltransferase [Microdochium bolleyi]|uniref:Methyltransferase n=1 Tax=Microdochium bolleyi TaxID=196109 RepID=A0A136ISX1_9PEZI|nr:methyltransferase [Microdochium bolleyi]